MPRKSKVKSLVRRMRDVHPKDFAKYGISAHVVEMTDGEKKLVIRLNDFPRNSKFMFKDLSDG